MSLTKHKFEQKSTLLLQSLTFLLMTVVVAEIRFWNWL